MIVDPKRKPHQDDGEGDKRRRQEEALDEALKNTFPASDPVSVEQPTRRSVLGARLRISSPTPSLGMKTAATQLYRPTSMATRPQLK
jgi:hypothetical protein